MGVGHDFIFAKREKMKTPFTFNNPHSRFDIDGDKSIFNRIVEDMKSNGGKLTPSDHWNQNLAQDHYQSEYTDELYNSRYRQMQLMIEPWVGCTGMKPLSEEAVNKYELFLRDIDFLQLLPDDILSFGQLNGWRETDLGSIMDINLINIFRISTETLRICEVGGGYGRLAEIFLSQYTSGIHYVLVDAVPGSLMYAYLYLKSQFPDRHIGCYYNGDVYDNSFDCYIIPSWHSQVLPRCCFDICINIESMQEMEYPHVDFYLSMFDRLALPQGLIYLSNARDYVFKGIWNIPPHWETLYLSNTPRSWTPDHPTHIMCKQRGNYSNRRIALEGAFKGHIYAWKATTVIQELTQNIADRDRICGKRQQTIAEFQGLKLLNRIYRKFAEFFK